MGAYNEMDASFAGLAHGIEKKVETAKCGEALGIPFGRAVMAYSGDKDGGYNMKQDTLLLTLSADLVSLNSVALTINGVAIGPVVFLTSHNNTMNLIKAAIEAAFTGEVVTLTDAVNNRQITVYIKDTVMSGSGLVTLGASQATITPTLTSVQIFRGLSLHVQKGVAAASLYEQNEAMNVLTEGQAWVETSGTVVANEPAYVVESGASAGKFFSSGYASGGRFRTGVTGAGLALVEVFGMHDGI